VRFPLTGDFSAARQVVDSLETGSVIVEGGTSASLGLDVALSAFDGETGAGRVILLITDGDDLGADPASVATRIRESGADLLVAGVGTPAGAPVPVFDARSRTTVDKRNVDGTAIVSKLNEPFLRALAAASGGRYLGSDLSVVPGAVAGRLAALQHTRFEERPSPIPIERFQWFAALALGALVLGSVAERLPRPRRHAMALAGVLAVTLLGPACASRAFEVNQDGVAAFHRGDTEKAIGLFLEAQALQPADPHIALNLAAAYHQGGRYDEAIIAARRLLSSTDPADRNLAYASIGHHEYAAGRLENALDAFKHALLEDPADDVSRRDYEIVLRKLAPPPDDAQASPTPSPTEPDSTPGPSPQPGGNTAPGTPASPTPGASPSNPESLDRQVNQIDSQITQLINAAGENPTAAEALQILQLIAERNRLAAQRDSLAPNSDPTDY
jgi:Ca-activated chloride channel family protein